MIKVDCVPIEKVDITGGFWAERQRINREVTVYSVENRFRDTGRFEAFKFNWTEGSSVPKPHFFWDSDVAKWIEGAAYILEKNPNEELKRRIDEVIDLIEKNQAEDGYFNIYHTVVEPEKKFKDRDHHELYCLGHLLEAAVAYFNATGERKLLTILDGYVDLVIKAFVTEKTAAFVTPGHEEIELALFKVYRLTGDKKYLDLAMFFLNERGKRDEMTPGWMKRTYMQGHLPVREQKTAEGHSVRACYLYSGMADAVIETGDEEILDSCKSIFEDITERKMYITGGIGSSHRGEAFTIPYDLPNDTAYSETCASIALSMFAARMHKTEPSSRYADVIELEMYNGALAGLSLDGKSFFYENPLEVALSDRCRHTSVNDSDRLPITQRQEVFSCSCCPPNVLRYIGSMGETIYSFSDDRIYINQFMTSRASTDDFSVSMETDYPAKGSVSLKISSANKKYAMIRIPSWCRSYDIPHAEAVEDGYARVPITEGKLDIDFTLNMKPEFHSANPLVRADSGKAALTYGPIVYCMESVDNDFPLFDAVIDTNGTIEADYCDKTGCMTLTAQGSSACADDRLYGDFNSFARKDIKAKFIPYYAHANRGECDMTVWFRAK